TEPCVKGMPKVTISWTPAVTLARGTSCMLTLPAGSAAARKGAASSRRSSRSSMAGRQRFLWGVCRPRIRLMAWRNCPRVSASCFTTILMGEKDAEGTGQRRAHDLHVPFRVDPGVADSNERQDGAVDLHHGRAPPGR